MRRIARTLASVCWAFGAAAGGTAFGQIDFETFQSSSAGGSAGVSIGPHALADFDGDGHVDAAVTRGGQVTMFVGDGTGGFVANRFLLIPGGSAFSIAAADMDGDGRIDIVTGNIDQTTCVLLADGAGGFTPARSFTTGANAWASIAVADFDADGRADIVIGGGGPFESTTAVTLLLGNGMGNLGTHRDFTMPIDVKRIETGDFDENGLIDVVGVGFDGLFFARGDGTGGLGAVSSFRCVSLAFGRGHFVRVGDVDEDGHLDVVTSACETGGLDVHRGDGLGGFARSGVSLTAGFRAKVGVLADVDVDGHLDVVVVGEPPNATSPDRLVVLRGNGAGGLVIVEDVPSRITSGLSVADVDEDGRMDAVISAFDSMDALRGNGTAFEVAPSALVGFRPTNLLRFDVDGDGAADVVSLAGDLGNDRATVFVVSNNGGRLGSVTSFPAASQARSMTAGDWDEDGSVDLALASPRNCCGGVGGSEPGRIEILGRNAAGGFATVGTLGSGTDFRNITSGDLDHDGHRDLVAIASGTRADVYRGDGTGGFLVGVSVAVPSNTAFLALRDVDADGSRDLVTCVAGGAVTVNLGDGSGGFGSAVSSALPSAFRPLAIADVSEDGCRDLIGTATDGAGVSILTGDGSGGFVFAASFATGGVTRQATVGDFDEDGHADLAVTLQPVSTIPTGADVVVFRGDGALGFAASRRFGIVGGATDLAVGDVDADGHVDLVVASDGTQTVGSTKPGLVTLLRNRSLDARDALRGNVNGGAGAIADALFVNGSAGAGNDRRVTVDRGAALEIRVNAPPSNPAGPAPLTCYAWPNASTSRTVNRLPFGLGQVAMPTPLTPGVRPQPVRTANSIGHVLRLGTENWPGPPTSAAPTVLVRAPNGVGISGTITLQGFLRDAHAPNGRTAVTNGVTLVLR